MDAMEDKDWKKKLGFPINYDSGQSSDDDFDRSEVVMRHPRHSSRYLLQESGDGSEADLLGTTPPRAIIRNKEKRRSILDGRGATRPLSGDKKPSEQTQPIPPERFKRASQKKRRSQDCGWKVEMGQLDHKADSLPSPAPTTAAIPTLVESCNRFMSLTSRLKCRDSEDEVQERWADAELPASRVTFHRTFSMLINMGNVDKGCRRTISREEQVWQNELKDLIWLELQAKLAGRSLARQDAFLCAQRGVVPAVVRRVLDYKFVNPNPCTERCKRLTVAADGPDGLPAADDDESCGVCVSLDCRACSDAVGAAMRAVSDLLDAFYAALALYPSSTAARHDQPLLNEPRFHDRIRAMCLWYNVALHMRLKMLSIRRVLRTLLSKQRRRAFDHAGSTDSSATRKSDDSPRPCQVRFDTSSHTTDSSNSDSSGQSDGRKEPEDTVDCAQAELDAAAKARKVSTADCPLGLRPGGGDATPEIVISESCGADGTGGAGASCGPNDTYDTTASSESGYGSAGERDGAGDVLDMGDLDDLTRQRLLGRVACSPYREYYHEMLKTQSVRRCMTFMNKMCNNLLSRVYFTLLEPQDSPNAFVSEEPSKIFGDSGDGAEKSAAAKDEEARNAYELRRYGCWSRESVSMALPSYRSHFLLLSAVCMEAAHDYLALRLDTCPDRPSCLTVKQLIHELKEGLDIATAMRASFVRHVRAALRGRRAGAAARAELRLLLTTFDGTVHTALQQYLSYLRTMSGTEALPRAWLTAEWAFAARLAARAPHAADLAPAAFTDMACNQLQMVLHRFEEKLQKVMAEEPSEPLDHDETRYVAYAMCRATQDVFAREREPTLAAAQWARALAARLPRPHHALRRHLANSLMSIRDCIVRHTRAVFAKTRPDAIVDVPRDLYDSISPRMRELLLQVYKLGFELHSEMYQFAQAPLRARARAPPRRPASLQPRRAPPAAARRRRPDTVLVHDSFHPLIHKELHKFVSEMGAANAGAGVTAGAGAGPRRSVQESPGRRLRLLRSESIGEEPAMDDDIFDRNQCQQTESDLEALLGGPITPEPAPADGPDGEREREAGAEAEAEASEDEAEWARRVANAIIDFAKCWMQFVVERCERGRGLRPRWASQGLEFLMLACEPCNTRHLSDDEFRELKQLMDGCISHVIGSRAPPRAEPAAAPAAAPASPALSPAPPARPRHKMHSPLSGGSVKEAPTPPTPPSELEPLDFTPDDPAAQRKRMLEAIAALESARDSSLRRRRAVGRVLEAAVASYEPRLRQVAFKWQRGLKIGAGTFGKVYTVVNTETGQLLAMKEISVCAGDRRALRRAANELRVLEGVLHPHLVRYYGCELHREEMLLFMELCVEGSLEALVGTVGALAEHTVRRYTKQLLSAVGELHARAIAHRDIKSGNIFLTNEGHCLKLGDFGCAVKIRANTTAPGELQGFVGTQAYMAPEVFMKSSGHGRAADIWSLGCVVTEMASGKRPFSEYDSNYQIMFVVGMGGRPDVPPTLSEEGRRFCLECLTHDPDQRPRAEALALHHFLMVKSEDDDCKCEPAHLSLRTRRAPADLPDGLPD